MCACANLTKTNKILSNLIDLPLIFFLFCDFAFVLSDPIGKHGTVEWPNSKHPYSLLYKIKNRTQYNTEYVSKCNRMIGILP